MNTASIFDWFAQDSVYAAEHTDEPRPAGHGGCSWRSSGRRPALQASNGVEAGRRHFVSLHLI